MTDDVIEKVRALGWPNDRPEVPRPPGRHYFDAQGADHLRETIRAELADLMDRGVVNGASPSPRSDLPAFDGVDMAAVDLLARIRHAASLYGAPLGTAIDDGLTTRIRELNRFASERHAAVESAWASESTEVERLTRELARAQVAYDQAVEMRDLHFAQGAEVRRLLGTALDDLGVQRALAETMRDEAKWALRRAGHDPRSTGSILGAARRRAQKLAHDRRHPTQEDTSE
jgi:hypothetical protein